MSKHTKPESSRLNALYVLLVLKKYTDEEHPLPVQEICKKVNREFGHLSEDGQFMSSDTVKRTLDHLAVSVFRDDIRMWDTIDEYGFRISCLVKADGNYVPCDSERTEGSGKRYYYYDSSLTTAEIRTLIDAVETYSYFSDEDVTAIINKLIRLRPRSFLDQDYRDRAGDIREENSLLLMNIDLLNRIIAHGNCAKITYCNYDMSKKLVPRPGYPREIEPLSLMWSNGYYYLLVYYEKYQNIVNFRIDRITEIEEIDRRAEHLPADFNPVQYRFEHPVMYGGKKEHFVLLCRDTGKNYIMNTIMDVFGRKARITKADDRLLEQELGQSGAYYQEQGITWLKVCFESSAGGVELWATQYCNDCLIVSPEASRERVRDRLKQGMEYWRDR